VITSAGLDSRPMVRRASQRGGDDPPDRALEGSRRGGRGVDGTEGLVGESRPANDRIW
jgi:hypothetical protein